MDDDLVGITVTATYCAAVGNRDGSDDANPIGTQVGESAGVRAGKDNGNDVGTQICKPVDGTVSATGGIRVGANSNSVGATVSNVDGTAVDSRVGAKKSSALRDPNRKTTQAAIAVMIPDGTPHSSKYGHDSLCSDSDILFPGLRNSE